MVVFQNVCSINQLSSMLRNHHHYLLPYLILAVITLTRGLVIEGPMQCSTQINDIGPGQAWNLTVPCARCVSAELQLANGSIRSLPTVSAGCASATNQTDLQLYLSDTVPLGSLNMTVFCSLDAPTCYSFRVKASNEKIPSQDYSLKEVCSQDNTTATTMNINQSSHSAPPGAGSNSQAPSQLAPTEASSTGQASASGSGPAGNGAPLPSTQPASTEAGSTGQASAPGSGPAGNGAPLPSTQPASTEAGSIAQASAPGSGPPLPSQPAAMGSPSITPPPQSTCLCSA